jgi:hypothetical protein
MDHASLRFISLDVSPLHTIAYQHRFVVLCDLMTLACISIIKPSPHQLFLNEKDKEADNKRWLNNY